MEQDSTSEERNLGRKLALELKHILKPYCLYRKFKCQSISLDSIELSDTAQNVHMSIIMTRLSKDQREMYKAIVRSDDIPLV